MIKQIKIEFIFGRIAEKENITISDDDFKSFVDYLVSSGNSQMADENAVYKYYGGGNKEDGKKHFVSCMWSIRRFRMLWRKPILP